MREENARERVEAEIAEAKATKEVKRLTWIKRGLIIADTAILAPLLIVLVVGIIKMSFGGDYKLIEKTSMIVSFSIPLMIVFSIAERFVARAERGEINKQIEYIKMREREIAESEKDADLFAAETDEKAESGEERRSLSEKENAELKELKSQWDLKKRTDAMRKHILFDILACVSAVAFFACTLIPFVTVLGEKYSIFYFVKDSLNSETRKSSEIVLALKQFFHLKEDATLVFITIQSWYTMCLIGCPVAIGIYSAIRLARLFVAYHDCEKNIKTQSVVLSLNETIAQKPRKERFFVRIIVFMGLSVSSFWILFSFLKPDDLDLGELYSVSPVTLILYFVCMGCFIGLNVYKYFTSRNNEQLATDKLYFTVYRLGSSKK